MEEHNVFPPVVSKEAYGEEVIRKVMHHSERIDRNFFPPLEIYRVTLNRK